MTGRQGPAVRLTDPVAQGRTVGGLTMKPQQENKPGAAGGLHSATVALPGQAAYTQ